MYHKLTNQSLVETATGHRLFVRDWGQGRPIVLLAGWGMESRIWGETMLRLIESGHRAIAYDRRGHGRSDDAEIDGYDDLADDLAAILETLDLHDAVLVAHSGAAGEAIRYVSRHGSARLRGLVLVGAMGPKMLADAGQPEGVPQDFVDQLCRRLGSDLSGWIDENIAPFAPGTPRRINDWMSQMLLDCSRRAVVDFQRVILTADLRDEAAALALPVLIVHGARDVSAPLELTARRYAALIPGAELVVYDKVAHGVMVTDAARLAADIALRCGLEEAAPGAEAMAAA